MPSMSRLRTAFARVAPGPGHDPVGLLSISPQAPGGWVPGIVRSRTAADPVRLAGELDVHTAPELQRHLDAVIQRRDQGPLVLDLTRVSFIDLSGIRVLDQLRIRLADSGRDVRLSGVSSSVAVLLAWADHEDIRGTTRDPSS